MRLRSKSGDSEASQAKKGGKRRGPYPSKRPRLPEDDSEDGPSGIRGGAGAGAGPVLVSAPEEPATMTGLTGHV